MISKRVVIVDFNHQAHSYFHSKFRLSKKVMNERGEWEEKDTTVQSGCIKNIYNWSKRGTFPTAVCFDRPCPSRKGYFAGKFPDMKMGTEGEYKGGRSKMPEAMFTAIADCESILRQSGVSVFSKQGYEADDLIYACVKQAKKQYPGMPIDIVTNDADLLPLVDETVSVFLRSKKGTYAEDPKIEKSKYIQVTPRNYSDVVMGLSAYSGFAIPYNSILLYKLLRGDPSDNYRRKDISKMFPPTKYNDMILRMMNDHVNFEEIFRYGDPVKIVSYKDGRPFNGTFEEAMKSPDKAKLQLTFGRSEELDCILEVLGEYTDMDEEMLKHVEYVYTGMNLNQPYLDSNPMFRRVPFKAGSIDTFSEKALHEAAGVLDIRVIRA